VFDTKRVTLVALTALIVSKMYAWENNVPVKTRILVVHELPLFLVLLVGHGYDHSVSSSSERIPKPGEGLLGPHCTQCLCLNRATN
jgi:hypothetical protein